LAKIIRIVNTFIKDTGEVLDRLLQGITLKSFPSLLSTTVSSSDTQTHTLDRC